jgi:hypothetical protein
LEKGRYPYKKREGTGGAAQLSMCEALSFIPQQRKDKDKEKKKENLNCGEKAMNK